MTTNIHQVLPNLSGRHYSWTPEGEPAIIGKRVCITIVDNQFDLWFANWDSWIRDDSYAEPLSGTMIGILRDLCTLQMTWRELSGEAYATLPLSEVESLESFLQCNKKTLGVFPKKQLSEQSKAALRARGFKKAVAA
jgi:hypothetical protein